MWEYVGHTVSQPFPPFCLMKWSFGRNDNPSAFVMGNMACRSSIKEDVFILTNCIRTL